MQKDIILLGSRLHTEKQRILQWERKRERKIYWKKETFQQINKFNIINQRGGMLKIYR